MAHCPNCGTDVTEGVRFCSNCAHPLQTAPDAVAEVNAPSGTNPTPPIPRWLVWLFASAETEAAPPPSSPVTPEVLQASPSPPPLSATSIPVPPAALGLDDVPRWLGWLAIPISLTVIGVPIYCIWAYRRGRTSGVGLDPTEQPYPSMGWLTVGWGLGLFVPILTWYVAVHLPTLWYKHGLRVGAKEGTASPRSASSAVIGAAFFDNSFYWLPIMAISAFWLAGAVATHDYFVASGALFFIGVALLIDPPASNIPVDPDQD